MVAACGGGNAAKKVLVIGLDGIRVDILAEATTPNIDRLIAESFFNDQARTNVRTVSGPGLAPPISLDSRLAKTAGPERKGRDGPEAEGEQGDRRS